MDRGGDVVPSSPTISSPSSSDLDTESTGSFFHDRSTTLGTLMGVNLYQAAAAPAAAPTPGGGAAVGGGARRRRRKRSRRGWWRLCRGKDMGPTSLADFLQVERRLSGGAAQFLYGGGGGGATEIEAVGGDPLFHNGRVLPPSGSHHRHESAGSLGRLPVLLIGICSGGDG
ncbi:uncharacterized protein At3g17950 [Wolffia australiana]